jgi:hypothetical protein
MQIIVINIEKIVNYKYIGERWADKSSRALVKAIEDKNIKDEWKEHIFCLYRSTEIGQLGGK